MSEKKEYIRIRGAREHNLKNINIDIPRNEFVVLTGLSGSGKSSLAFDTIYAEGQRRYMESLSSYARQFLGQMEKPDVDDIQGLSPAISIDQKSTNRNPRSTVGTVTEIYDYLRLLYARVGIPHCPKCGKVISKQTVDQIVDILMKLPERTKIQLLAPIVRGRKGEHVKILKDAKKSGYVRVRIDGNLYDLAEEIKLEKNKKHNIEIIVDRLMIKEGIENRLTDSIETVMKLTGGLLLVDVVGGEPMNFSQSFSCPDCGISIDEIEHRYLELVMDEIFGSANRIDTFVWQNNYGGGAKSNYVVHLHEYVLCFAKNISTVGKIELPPDENILKYYKYKDEKFDTRGPYRLQPLATTSMDDRPNLRYPLFYEGHEVWPAKQWFWSKERALEAQANDELVFSEKNGKWTVNYKQYLNGADGTQRKSKPYSIITGIYTQAGTKAIKEIMGSGKAFDFPKPPELIMYFIQMITGEDDIILDSFAGSGTTAHAVLNMNKADGGHRKFILVEMMDYADSITAERVKRVIKGYGEGKNAVEGTGGNFSFYDLGEPLLVGDCLNEAVAPEKIREYIWFMETKQPYAPPSGGNPYYLGKHNSTGYYFYYEPQRVTVLDYAFLSTITEKADGTVIYADRSSISEDKLAKMGVTFKKIPRDISRL